MTEPVIRLEKASKRFLLGPPWARREIVAVLPVSLAIMPGEMLAVVGESGSGKTTLARLCLGLLQPTAGTIFFQGVAHTRHRRRSPGEVAAVLQNPSMSLDPKLRIGSSIAEPLRIAGADGSKRVAELLDRVGLPANFASRFPHELSGGQRQRVVIARALSTSPRLIVFDEAVSALDVSIQAQVLNLIRDLQAEVGFAGLFITHDIAVARYIAHRALVMKKGEVVDEISSAALYKAVDHHYTRHLQEMSGVLQNTTAETIG
jgi:ABC-type glutathione transport system ATPase component